MLKVPKERDFIVRFMSNSARMAFVGLLTNHAQQNGKYINVKEHAEMVIMENSLTAERRAKAIESFLKAAFKNLVTDQIGVPRHEDLGKGQTLICLDFKKLNRPISSRLRSAW